MNKEFEDLLGQYWDLAHLEGKSGVSQGDKANEVLHALKKLAEQPAQQITEAQVEAALKAAHMHSTPESRKDMRRAIEATAPQPAQQQEFVAHCEAGPEHCPICLAETRSLALAAAVGYIQRNTPKLVSEEICRALKKASPPAQRKPLTDEQLLHFVDIHVGAPSMAYPLDNSDWITFARAIEAAHGIKGNT